MYWGFYILQSQIFLGDCHFQIYVKQILSVHTCSLRPLYKHYLTYWCVLRRVAGWVAGGCWDDEIDS